MAYLLIYLAQRSRQQTADHEYHHRPFAQLPGQPAFSRQAAYRRWIQMQLPLLSKPDPSASYSTEQKIASPQFVWRIEYNLSRYGQLHSLSNRRSLLVLPLSLHHLLTTHPKPPALLSPFAKGQDREYQKIY